MLLADVPNSDRHRLQMVLGGCASLAGVAALQGLKGAEVLIGITAGFVLAYECHTLTVDHVPSASWDEVRLIVLENLLIFGLSRRCTCRLGASTPW